MKLLKNRVFIGIACIILASIIAFVAVPVVNNLANATTIVVRAKQDITMGTRITDALVEEVEMGKKNLPEGTVYKKDDIVGKYFITDLNKGDIVLAAKVTTTLVLPEAKIRSMAYGENALSIKLSGASNQRLLPNDIVSIYAKTENGAVLVPELKYLSVVTTTTANDVEILKKNQTAADGSPLTAASITFIVNDIQAQKLLSLEGKMNIILKYRGNSSAMVSRFLDEQAAYFGGSTSPSPDETTGTTSPNQAESGWNDIQ